MIKLFFQHHNWFWESYFSYIWLTKILIANLKINGTIQKWRHVIKRWTKICVVKIMIDYYEIWKK